MMAARCAVGPTPWKLMLPSVLKMENIEINHSKNYLYLTNPIKITNMKYIF